MENHVQNIKQRFEIIGNDAMLNRAIAKAERVAPTDISVLVVGESGVGKESIPKIIHQYSHRKHNKYIAVIVVQYQKELLIPNYSVMKKELLLEQQLRERDILKLQMAVLFF